jgi:hypothetical protein
MTMLGPGVWQRLHYSMMSSQRLLDSLSLAFAIYNIHQWFRRLEKKNRFDGLEAVLSTAPVPKKVTLQRLPRTSRAPRILRRLLALHLDLATLQASMWS